MTAEKILNSMKGTYIGRGTGRASLKEGNTNILLERNDDNLMIDVGKTFEFIWEDELGKSPLDVKNIYISHKHDDHVLSLAYVGLFSYLFRGKTPVGRPKLYAHERVMEGLWDVIKGQCETLELEVGEMEMFFECHPLKDNESFEWQGYNFQPVQTHHISNGNVFMPSYGLVIQRNSDDPEVEYQKTFITTDTQFCPHQMMMILYNACDQIHQDCEVGFRSGVHSNWDDLKTLKTEILEKMTMNHYKNKPDDWEKYPCKWAEKGGTFTL